MPRGVPKTRKTTTRKPVSYMGRRNKLDVSYLADQPEYKNKQLRWVNNEGGQVQSRMAEGWEVVKGVGVSDVWRPNADEATQKDTYITKPVGLGANNQPIEAVLMMIDKDIFSEMRAEEAAYVDQTEIALKGGAGNEAGSDASGVETYAANTSDGGRGFSVQNEN